MRRAQVIEKMKDLTNLESLIKMCIKKYGLETVRNVCDRYTKEGRL